MNTLKGDAFQLIHTDKTHYDLVLTSPPAWPNKSGGFGSEETLDAYLLALRNLIIGIARRLKRGGILCLVIQPLESSIMERLARFLVFRWTMLATYHYSNGTTGGSWVVFLSTSGGRLNQKSEAWKAEEWFFPLDTVDTEYGWFEFPRKLVETILGLALPDGGTILDPFLGKGAALRALDPAKYRVTGYVLSEVQPTDLSKA